MYKTLSLIITVLYEIVNLSTAITSRYPPYYNGTCMRPSLCTGAILNNLCDGTDKFCVSQTDYYSVGLFTLDQILSVTQNNTRIQSIYKYIIAPNVYMKCHEKAAYLAQLAFESLGFMNSEELGQESYFDKYENRNDLGNNQVGDGRKYRGRGFIQLTGRANYADATAALNIDLINNPELAAFPYVAGKIAVWYWSSKNLISYSDGTFYGYSKLTKLINGGLNGLGNRTLLLEKTVSKLQCGKIIKGHGKNCTSKIGYGVGYCKPMCVTYLENKEYCVSNGMTESGLCPDDPTNVKCTFEKCDAQMDLAFLLDSSGSIVSTDFQYALKFMYDVVNGLNIGVNATRVAIINFSTSIKVEAYFNTFYNKTQLLNYILNIIQFAQSTNTGEALEKCLDIFDIANGMRPSADGVSKLIIVLTDGQSNGLISPKTSASKLKSKGISIFSIGVGSSVNYNELNDIASDNSVFLLSNYNAALTAIEDIKQTSCLEPATIPEATNSIEITKDSYRYYVYPLSSYGNKTYYLIVQVLLGNVKVFYSTDIKNPNDQTSTVDLARKRRQQSQTQQFDLKQLNASKLYIGVRGLEDINMFKIEISNTKMSLNEANRFYKSNIFILISVLSIYFK